MDHPNQRRRKPVRHTVVKRRIECCLHIANWKDRQADRQAVRQADRQTDRQIGRQTGRQADRQADRHAYRQAGRQTDRQRQLLRCCASKKRKM